MNSLSAEAAYKAGCSLGPCVEERGIRETTRFEPRTYWRIEQARAVVPKTTSTILQLAGLSLCESSVSSSRRVNGMPRRSNLIPRVPPPELVHERVLEDFGLERRSHTMKSKVHLEAIGDALRDEPHCSVIAYRVAVHPAPQVVRMPHVDCLDLTRHLNIKKKKTCGTVVLDVLLVCPMLMFRLEQLPTSESRHGRQSSSSACFIRFSSLLRLAESDSLVSR